MKKKSPLGDFFLNAKCRMQNAKLRGSFASEHYKLRDALILLWQNISKPSGYIERGLRISMGAKPNIDGK